MTTDGQLTDLPGDTASDDEVDQSPDDNVPGDGAGKRQQWRRVAGWVLTTLACLLVLFALVAPNDLNRYTLWAFLRIPVEGLVFLALVLVLPARTRRVVAVIVGAVFGLLSILKIFDIGFFAVLYRPFDPVLDWAFVDAGVNYVEVTIGRFWTIVSIIGGIVLLVASPVLMALAALRLTRIVNRHRTAAIGTARVLAVAWIVFAVLGVQTTPDLPVASTSATDYAYLHARQVPDGIRDQREFAKEVVVDAFRDIPDDQLLTALRGKDVLLTFVESYGRSAIEHPELAPEIGAVLDAGNSRLRAAGFSSRSGFLRSATFGGGSWLAHATVVSGLRIDNQQRYRNLVTTDRMTLNRAFQRAGWRTVDVEPAIIQAWPEGAFFGYSKIYNASALGYRGPRFGYATMPDQYILSAFHRAEGTASPLMAQITLLSSHAPWTPIPRQIGWTEVGDGSIYNSMASGGAKPEEIFQRASVRVRADYGTAITYSLNSLISYVETYGDDNLVLVFLGDHQPASVVTGQDASRDVPITIVARDPAVLDRISGWGWQDGLKPNPQAPVWRMDEFRDQFLSAFGSQGR